MKWEKVSQGYRLFGAAYDALLTNGDWPVLKLAFDGMPMAELPLCSTVDQLNAKEQLSDPRFTLDEQGVLHVICTSSLWSSRSFDWYFEEQGIRMAQRAEGQGSLGRCCYVGTGVSAPFGKGDSQGVETNARLLTEAYFSPAVNLANSQTYDTSEPCSIGLSKGAFMAEDTFAPRWANDLFVPPLCYVFHTGEAAMSVGLCARPGDYRFCSFNYSGMLYCGASFYVDYLGYTRLEDIGELPQLVIRFGYGPWSAMESYVKAVDALGGGTEFTHPTAKWHREPIFCGWSAQTAAASAAGERAHTYCTQENYEAWMAELDKRGIPYGTVVIDDKWQAGYGSCEVDTDKWPDLKGFVNRCHEKGHHVLLWLPVLHVDGLPAEECILDSKGTPLMANLAHPGYAERFRSAIAHLVGAIGVDGFKEDWINVSVNEPGLSGYGQWHGLELLAAFQRLLYDTVHSIKPDALIETQTPNPIFRCCSDMLRLNDLWYATRNVPNVMRQRARIARIAGWRLFDCDDGAASGLAEWAAYAQYQPQLGVPALYFVYETEATHERPTDEQWRMLADCWHAYRRSHV